MKQQLDGQSIMSKFRINETFSALQGEGKSLGMPVIFIRFYGCNIRCPWCDSLYAVEDKEFTEMPINEILSRLTCEYRIKRVVLTGGEPLLQIKSKDGIELLKKIKSFKDVEIETNGLLIEHKFICDCVDYIDQINISPKFYSNTKFNWENKYLTDDKKTCFRQLINNPSVDVVYKFVLEDGEKRQQCIENIEKFVNFFEIPNKLIYIMSEGQTFNQQINRMKNDLEFCLRRGWNYTPRMHILVYDQQRGV